jgi:hypothetical protein
MNYNIYLYRLFNPVGINAVFGVFEECVEIFED